MPWLENSESSQTCHLCDQRLPLTRRTESRVAQTTSHVVRKMAPTLLHESMGRHPKNIKIRFATFKILPWWDI